MHLRVLSFTLVIIVNENSDALAIDEGYDVSTPEHE
jgi:hypothetical protein